MSKDLGSESKLGTGAARDTTKRLIAVARQVLTSAHRFSKAHQLASLAASDTNYLWSPAAFVCRLAAGARQRVQTHRLWVTVPR